ncbi:hypothetical protein D9611_014171 [Ephemerocybe angulata]|uniref:Beta-xylanase n=1 Tax=Ephemerocybe angulata TaxID=980116 RepID=A0A8H5FEN3_9AGAR|nr:hypothetical protein D9611_014171 [Tulosesus angulatus]
MTRTLSFINLRRSFTTLLLATAGYHYVEASLNSMMQANGKLYFGNIIDTNTMQGNEDGVLKGEFGMFTPEYSWKWNRIQPEKGKFHFNDSDAVMEWAEANGKQIRGHTLVWHQNIPDWVDAITDKEDLMKVIKDHINKAVGRYKGRVYAWDVVNEVFNEDGTFRDSVFYRVLGEDFIPLAFRTAREADPNAKLYINEYNLDYAGPKIDAMLNLVHRLQAQNVPIDAIGSQTHLTSGRVNEVPAQLKRLASTGLDIAVTELDIRIKRPVTPAKLQQQKGEYALVTKGCLEVPACVGISMWGVSDQNSWVKEALPAFGAPLMWDGNLRRKGAYGAVDGLLRKGGEGSEMAGAKVSVTRRHGGRGRHGKRRLSL